MCLCLQCVVFVDCDYQDLFVLTTISALYSYLASTMYTLYTPLHMHVSMLHLFICLLKTANEKSIMTVIILFCNMNIFWSHCSSMGVL